MTNAQIAVLQFGNRRAPRALECLPAHSVQDRATIDAALDGATRVAVVGSEADLAAVLTRLMRSDRLDVEVAHIRNRFRSKFAVTGVAQRIPLIRDETGTALVSSALVLPPNGHHTVSGEAVVDDAVLFDGSVAGLRIEPIPDMPGLRAAVLSGRMRPHQWLTGRAVQIGTTGAVLVRDGIPAPREVNRTTFYRHTKGWLRVA